jgi:TatD DNase family protein
VTRCVTIASDADDAVAALALAREHEGVHATAGIHPHAADSADDRALARVDELLAEPLIVAVGETGLDYHYDNSDRGAQRRAFDAHLALAAEHDLPVVVHSRSADDDTAAAIRACEGSVRGVLHCFAGGPGLFETGVRAGWWVSFSGLLTFPSYDRRDLALEAPPDRLLIETDSPYLAPVPHRGRTNEPAYVIHVAAAVAALTGETAAAVAERTTRNALAFYDLAG